MADLKTNYVDDVLDTTKNQLRKYQQIQNDDGTVSFVDVTEYTQVGTSFGAKDINDTNAAINDVNGKLESLLGRLIRVKSISAGGTAGTYSTDIELNSDDVYFVIERPTNSNDSLMITPIINGYFNPTYINIVNGKIAIIFSGPWGFAHIYKLV